MCGIFGFVAAPGQKIDRTVVHGMLTELFRLSEPRGQEASGLVLVGNGTASVYKRPLKPSLLLESPGYTRFLEDGLARMQRDAKGQLLHPLAAMGHCRLVTNGAQTTTGNNQPIVADHTIGLHNGIITNEEQLWKSHPQLTRTVQSDTEVIVRLMDEHAAKTSDLAAALRDTFAELEGTASVALIRDDADALVLATNNGSLYHVAAANGLFFFASERYILQTFLERQAIAAAGPIEGLQPGMGAVVSLMTARALTFPLGAGQPAVPLHASDRLVLRDMPSEQNRLVRCTRCILPSTYPFISFDTEGVCNFCRDHAPPQLAGPQALEAELAKYRRSDGQPDCIVAFSGGRDSSYGLHLLKTEYGMHPVAYSYDWGMVTGIARRNQARMCSQLGVEHIFRAADITAKRRYMRKNILAWLERPHLGMVPLFMAGDKFFYGIGRQLRKELGIPLVIFCAGNPLERTDFKGGFAGVRESQHGNRLFAFSMANKVQIAAFYALQYLLNPSYLNESMVDSFGSFFTTFVGKDDFLYLYHYLPWVEDTIDGTLLGQYGFEGAPHTDNLWRIGDGYTTFINHIYLSVAGFSEFDVYRSQQIRAGLLTREAALAKVAHDNVPGPGILEEFAAQVGINLDEVLSTIDAIPKLY